MEVEEILSSKEYLERNVQERLYTIFIPLDGPALEADIFCIRKKEVSNACP